MPQTDDWTIRSLLEWTTSFFEKKGLETPKLEAEILLAFVLKKTRIDLYVNYDVTPSEEERSTFRELVRRRGTGEPTAYLVGKKEFYSLDFEIERGILIPRPETEELVLKVIEDVKRREKGWEKAKEEVEAAKERGEEPSEEALAALRPKYLRFCDVGTGSGCIAVSLVKNVPNSVVAALDINPQALILAKKNATNHGVSRFVSCIESDILSGFDETPPEDKRLDYLISNPPYVSEKEYETLEPTVRDFEPREALVGGETGAEIALEIIEEAPDFLKIGGKVYFELSPTTVEIVADALRESECWTDVEIMKDYAHLARYVVATHCE